MIAFTSLTRPCPAPANLLPAGLPYVISGMAPVDATRGAFFQTTNGELHIEAIPPGQDTQDPFAQLWPRIDAANPQADRNKPVVFGPPVDTSTTGGCHPLPAPAASAGAVNDRTEIGIIDAGICFWNPAFLQGPGSANPGHSRFASLGGLVIRNKRVVSSTLDADDIANLVGQSDELIRAELGQRYPDSIYNDHAPTPLMEPDGLAHGTAMTDLIVSQAPPNAPLHGLELPVSVLRDLTGGQMSAIMEVALRSMVNQMIANRAHQTEANPMVILMAFGFTGGPLDGSSPILKGLESALDSYRCQGHEITLVLPIGNHLQDQLHARLGCDQTVTWRLLPEDHSTNTVEIIHKADAKLTIAPPNGSAVDLPLAGEGLYRVMSDGAPVGALWTEKTATPGVMQTRLSLLPTAAMHGGAPVAPFGPWTLCCTKGAADLWILRDETGFETDVFRPARASWFEDAAYRATDALGEPARDDAPDIAGGPLSVVHRDGSASVLASSRQDGIAIVTAVEASGKPAFYASLLPDSTSNGSGPQVHEISLSGADDADHDPIGPFVGRAVLGNAGPDRFRAMGTSLAAALYAGQLASTLSAGQ